MYNFIALQKERREAQKKWKNCFFIFFCWGRWWPQCVIFVNAQTLPVFLKFKMQALKFLSDLHSRERKPFYTSRKVGF